MIAGGLACDPQNSFQLILSKSKMRRLRNVVSGGPAVLGRDLFQPALACFLVFMSFSK
jgi:hypothetical protein